MNKKLLPVKPFRETEGMCGPASLKMVLDYYGINKSEKELAKICKTTKELGTSNEAIKEAAEFLGFNVKMKDNSTFEDIKFFLDKKIPVIVNWFTRGRVDYDDSDIADGHYSVIVGLDDVFIYIQDPELGNIRKIKKDDFLTVWFDFKGKYIKPDELIIRQTIAVYK